MNQTKVYEFAKEVGIETLALMDKIREWKLPIKSHMAVIEPELMTEIRNRLSAETGPKEKPKKTAVKKAVPKEKVAKPAAEKAAAGTTAKKRTVKKDVVKAPIVSESPKKATGVIRRKAGAPDKSEEAVAVSVEASMGAAAEELVSDIEVAAPSIEGSDETPEVAAAHEAVSTPSDAAAPAPPRRGNIIGRMDLRRVAPRTPPPRSSGTGQGAVGTGQNAGNANQTLASGAAAGRPLRTAQRNIRTGFFAAPAMGVQETEVEAKDDRKKKGLGVREGENQHFSATEFRKREVIFQPKKKKSITGRGEVKKTQITTPKAHKRVVKVHETIKVSELAMVMGLKASELTKKLISNGVMANLNTALDFDTVALIVPEFGWEAVNLHRSEEQLVKDIAFGNLTADLVTRPPVVTVMGHVDHGKTTLLDAIRNANVAKGEAGGITQHIGAYSVTLPEGKVVTFLDTPGHEAFTAMRARGANVTDIVIIVVAADDGVMPQTAEAINHAKAAGVPIIVAVNKIDRPAANVDRIKQQLTEFEIVPEEWGGSQIFVEVSALQKKGIDTLLEQVLLLAEVADLKANPERSATGIVIESRMEKGRGPVATLLVKDGTLRVGQAITAGFVPGRIRSMRNDRGENVEAAFPGFPVEIMGLDEVPLAGDRFDVCESDEAARSLAEERKGKAAAVANAANGKMSLEQIFAKVKAGDVRELNVILKADVAGSLEAIKAMLEKLGNAEVKTKLVHSAVGGITESDVLLASTSNGLVLGFNVRPDGGAQRMAKEKNVEIKTYSIIYEMQDDLKKALSGLLAPEFVENTLGRAEVRNIFVVPKIGAIAGCAVVDGKIQRNALVRLVRDGKIVFEGKISSLRRFKDDAKEVAQGFECGIGIENFNDVKVGDVIEAYVREQVARAI